MATADNDRFLRLWYEIANINACYDATDYIYALYTGKKWFPYNKGGNFRRWYGNNEYVVNWQNDGKEVKSNIDKKTGRIRSHNYNGEYSFAEGITWTELSTGTFGARYSKKGFLFDSAGAKAFIKENSIVSSDYLISLFNSCVAQYYLDFLNPTLHYKPGDLAVLPLLPCGDDVLEDCAKLNINLSKQDWDSLETSWDFKKHPLI